MRDGFEHVHTVTEYEDGPRAGIADYNGIAHHFWSLWNDANKQYDPRMVLSPVDDATLVLALEDWNIWLRWQEAFHAGRTGIGKPRALPCDCARSAELKILLASALVPDRNRWFCARGVFRSVGALLPGQALPAFRVAWLRVESAVPSVWIIGSAVAPRGN